MKNQDLLIWILVAVVVLSFVFSGFGYSGYGSGGMMGIMGGSYGGGMMFFGWIYAIIILIALVLFIAWLVKQLQK